MGDKVLCDKGFTSKINYQTLINRFYLIPIIYPRKNTNINRIIADLNPPLDVFSNSKYKLEKWLQIVDQFRSLICQWTYFKQFRLEIEVFFNIAKNTLGLVRIHQYTLPSVEKKVAPIVFLKTKLISLANSQNIDVKTIPFW